MNLTFRLLCIFCLFYALCTPQAYAAGLPSGVKKQAEKAAASAVSRAGTPTKEALLLKKKHSLSLRAHQLEQDLLKNIQVRRFRKKQGLKASFLVFNSQNSLQNASGFAFEYAGKVWGVTSRHVAEDINQNLHIIVLEEGVLARVFPVQIIQMGTRMRTDAAIFEIPPAAAALLTPLKLSAKKPVLGQTLSSHGYGRTRINHAWNRVVLEVTGNQLKTFFNVSELERRGLCGGPLLNAQGEAVGMHCGSSKKTPAAYAVTAQGLKELVRTALGKKNAGKPLLFKGIRIGTLNIDEEITSIFAYQKRLPVASYVARPHAPITRLHLLESYVRDVEATLLVVRIKKAFSYVNGQYAPGKTIVLDYDIKTGQVLRNEVQNILSF